MSMIFDFKTPTYYFDINSRLRWLWKLVKGWLIIIVTGVERRSRLSTIPFMPMDGVSHSIFLLFQPFIVAEVMH